MWETSDKSSGFIPKISTGWMTSVTQHVGALQARGRKQFVTPALHHASYCSREQWGKHRWGFVQSKLLQNGQDFARLQYQQAENTVSWGTRRALLKYSCTLSWLLGLICIASASPPKLSIPFLYPILLSPPRPQSLPTLLLHILSKQLCFLLLNCFHRACYILSLGREKQG